MWAVRCSAIKDTGAVVDDFQLAYWRKHNRLHGWMEKLWINKGSPYHDGVFNQAPLELNNQDLKDLKTAIITNNLPETQGFFFGDDSYEEETKKYDLEFVDEAMKAIKDGYKIVYSSWW